MYLKTGYNLELTLRVIPVLITPTEALILARRWGHFPKPNAPARLSAAPSAPVHPTLPCRVNVSGAELLYDLQPVFLTTVKISYCIVYTCNTYTAYLLCTKSLKIVK